MNKDEYKTSDFWLAVFLKAKNLELLNVEWSGEKAFFVFRCNGRINELIRDFYNGASVSVSAIKSNYDDLKSALKNF